MSSSASSPLAGEGAHRARKESISHVSTCSSKSTRSTRTGSSKGKARKNGTTSGPNGVDDQVYWDPPPQSQVVRSIHQLKITSPRGCAIDAPSSCRPARLLDEAHHPSSTSAVQLSGMIHRAMPFQSLFEFRAPPPCGHRPKEPRKRRRSPPPEDSRPSSAPHPPNNPVPPPSRQALLQALNLKIASKKKNGPFKPPPAHRSNKPSTSSIKRPSAPKKPSSSSHPIKPHPPTISSSKSIPTQPS